MAGRVWCFSVEYNADLAAKPQAEGAEGGDLRPTPQVH